VQHKGGKGMNCRQKIKRLKRENHFLNEIINNTDEMKRLVDIYNNPLRNVVFTNTKLEHYRIVKGMAFPNECKDDVVLTLMSEYIAKELCPIIKENMKVEDYGNGSALEFKQAKDIKATFDLWTGVVEK